MAKGVFEDIKVADFSWAAAGPMCTRYLADYGATVVRVESHIKPDQGRTASPFAERKPGINRSMFFGRFHPNKYGVSFNLQNPKGQELAHKLISWADIVVESFSPGVIKRLELDYESVKEARPDLIYLSTSAQGQWGPHSHTRGYGHHAVALAGWPDVSGWSDRAPSPPYGAYGDFISARFAAASIMAALEYRRRTGKGQWIDQSQVETSLHFLSPLVMDYMTNGKAAVRQGNRLPYAAPHGVYPCKGDDLWIAICVFTEEEWEVFCHVMDDISWTKEPRFTTLAKRKENEDELDRLVGKWTLLHTPHEVESMMQAAGVAAHIVDKSSDLFQDPQLKHRGYFVRLPHSEMGNPAYERQTCCLLSKTPAKLSMPSPCLGEHNEYVCKEFLGLTDDGISDYIVEGAITVEGGEEFRFSI
ncbi:CaiB/BaiF CoA transferase family protein [Chloroflexota bacterium]